MAETFGCCGRHPECQLTGECVEKEADYLDYRNCDLYRNTISFKFPTLYKLKQKGLVEVQDNHLSAEGIDYLKHWDGEYNRLFLLLNIIFIMGVATTSRLSPREINQRLVKSIKILNI